MEKFSTIYHRAAQRHGSEDALEKRLTENTGPYNPEPKSDDRWLSEFTKRVFQAGFSWKVIETKWDGFEENFWKFNISRCARLDMDDMEKLTANKAIVRNPQKIKTVAQNAQMIQSMAAEKGSADAFIRGWPQSDYIGLLDYLNKHGSRLGTNTASYALRFSGVPSFILSSDVTAALIHADIIDKPATSKKAKRAIQQAFNEWAEESAKDLSYISRVLAMSIDGA